MYFYTLLNFCHGDQRARETRIWLLVFISSLPFLFCPFLDFLRRFFPSPQLCGSRWIVSAHIGSRKSARLVLVTRGATLALVLPANFRILLRKPLFPFVLFPHTFHPSLGWDVRVWDSSLDYLDYQYFTPAGRSVVQGEGLGVLNPARIAAGSAQVCPFRCTGFKKAP